LATVTSYFATLTVANISHHIFKRDAVHCVIKYFARVKTKRTSGTYWNTM